MKHRLGYITASSKTEAKKIVGALLRQKLIACANILPTAESLYVWEGQVKEAKEVVIIVKTLAEHENQIIKVVKKTHSYGCPCVVFLSLTHGNKEFLQWMKENC